MGEFNLTREIAAPREVNTTEASLGADVPTGALSNPARSPSGSSPLLSEMRTRRRIVDPLIIFAAPSQRRGRTAR